MIDRSREDGATSTAPKPRGSATAGLIVLAMALVCIGVVTLSPEADSVNLPFWCFRCGTRRAIDVLLNILLFVPLGIGLSLLGVRAKWAALFIVSATVAVEVLQFTVVAGRFASFRDILANTIGGLGGWQLAGSWRSLVSPSPAKAPTLGLTAASVWVAIQTFTAWAVMVVTPPPPWWAQIRLHDLGFPSVFTGDVVRLSLGTVPIRYSDQLEESAIVRKLLLSGAPMNAVLTGVEPTAGAAPILLLAADDTLSEIAALVQRGDDVLFRIRTRAAAVGLRNPAIRLDDVFAPASAHDTISLTAGYSDGRYRVASGRGVVHRELTIAASPSWIWALLMPIAHYSFGVEVRLLTAAWLFAALGLVGYWGGHAPARPRKGRRHLPGLPAAAAMVVTIILGLGLVPVAFSLPVAHWSEWLAAIAGSAGGWLLARHARTREAGDRSAAPSRR